MNSQKTEKRKVNPRQNANLLSKITFWFTTSIFKKGYRQELEEEDLFEVLPELETSLWGDRIEKQWDKYKQYKCALYWIFWNMFGKFYILLGLAMFAVNITFYVLRPMFLGKLVSYFTPGQKEMTKADAYLYSLLVIGFHLVDVVFRNNYVFIADCLVLKARTAICSFIYRKFLKLPASSLRHFAFGNIANIITRDINSFVEFFFQFNFTLAGFIAAIIICYNMYCTIGLPTVAVLVALGITIPFQVCMSIWISYLKLATSKKTDTRIEELQEALSNIRSTKMYVWEKHIERKIIDLRDQEMNILLKLWNVFFVIITVAIVINNVTIYLTFMIFGWIGQPLSAKTMYFIAGTFMSLTLNISVTIPYGIFQTTQFIVALKRIQNLFFNLESKLKQSEKTNYNRSTVEAMIQMKNVTVKTGDNVILQNIDFDIRSGLTLVTGHSSSGKTVLLLTILREFQVDEGTLFVDGNLSYASQEPWLFPSTIKQNIIFGSKHDESRYNEVIKACALQYDFGQIENGDLTIIADRGINLSKGQQCRINLARALYKDCDIYLLDDCLSSLDSLVAHSIFTNCIMNFLSNKIVLLVTYNTKWMPYASNILNLEDGVLNYSHNSSPTNLEVNNSKPIQYNQCANFKLYNENDDITSKTPLILKNIKPNQIYGESKKAGTVSIKTFKKYINLGGGIFWVILIFGLFVVTQLSLSYKDKLISKWANLEDQIAKIPEDMVLLQARTELIYKYTAVIVGIAFLTFSRASLLLLFSKKISLKLHNKMATSVINAPLRFFDHTFIGNIINRFSKDLVTVDENMPFHMLHLTAIFLETVGNLLLITTTDFRIMLVALLLVLTVIYLRHVYMKIGGPLKRLDASTKSPVIGYLNATLEGLPTIKVFNAERQLTKEFEKHHDVYNSASYLYLACTKAYVFFSDCFVGLFMAVTILQFTVFDRGDSPGDVGLVISLTLAISTVFFYGILKMSELETQMTSVERAIEYIDIKPEPKTGLKLKNWPTAGEIRFENIYLSVNQSKSYLLKDINFTIKPKEKIGVIGRTGAGKSSLISALFRLYETKGKITIDGVDIKTLSLNFLRSSLSVIPQDPILFNGTLRENIDPDKEHQDHKIWNALEAVNLRKNCQTLDVNIRELDLTCGQKQLLCLARVLIQNKKILILDEMVENVDSETEELISNVIEQKFSSLTVIKIAHKLKFVMNCDKILVLNNGEIVEWDSPNVLLQNKNGLFYQMVQTLSSTSSFN